MTIANPRYALPNKHHDVVDDINNLRTTICTVDTDIHSIEGAIPALSDRVPEVQNTVLCVESNLANTEIQNIEANRYLVVNRNGDGFECVESGGEPGGKTGQCSIKKSDRNVDIAWGNILDVSKNGMTIQENAEAGKKNETHIFVDEIEIENDEQLPKVNLTNYQIKSDASLDNNSSVIVCDNIEKVGENVELATNSNYGFVKVGNGFTNNAGVISAPIVSIAEENSVGIIRTGNGINVENGVISRAEIDPATFSRFGVVKFGHNLSSNQNDEMEISEMGNAATIYNLGHVKICNKGIVELEESTLHYRMFVTENLLVQFKIDFDVLDDFSFVLEVVSDGTHLLVFNENLNPQIRELPINRGVTRIVFTKKLGVPAYGIDISELEAPDPINLTPAIESCISSEFIITSGGGTWRPNQLLRTSYDGYCDIQELNFKFETLVCVDYVNYLSRSSSAAMGEFILRGSNDGKNWTTLIYKNGEIIYGKVYTELKGCFRYFNLKIGYNSDDNKPGGVTLWGTQIDNNESELIPITPYMASNQETFATLTGTNIVEGNASKLTDGSCDTYVILDKGSDNWLKYELSEARIANILELDYWFQGGSWSYSGDNQPNWFKLEGSNDDTTWTLLLERQYQGAELEKNNNFLFFEFDNQTAYKYYKFKCIATNSSASRWNICGLKLYQRARGKRNFYSVVPTLTSATQDGYEVTASSYYGSNFPYHAFDGSSGADNKWLSDSGDVDGAWLKVELPEATAVNTFQIQSPDEGSRDRAPKKFKIQGSSDDTVWTDLVSETNLSWSQNQTRKWVVENETTFKFYRILVEESNGANLVDIGEFSVGRTAYEYKRELTSYEYAVPVMNSSSRDGYVVSADSVYNSDFPAWRALDRSSSSSWTSRDATSTTPHWLKIYNDNGISADYINIVWHSEHYGIDYVISGSNDDETYIDLVTVTNNNNINPSYSLSNIQTFKYWKICITRINPNRTRTEMYQFDLINRTIVTEY